jgi:hypothetical protein
MLFLCWKFLVLICAFSFYCFWVDLVSLVVSDSDAAEELLVASDSDAVEVSSTSVALAAAEI